MSVYDDVFWGLEKAFLNEGLHILCVSAGCALCRCSDDDPAMFGEKVTLKEHKLSVHYFCLVRQRLQVFLFSQEYVFFSLQAYFIETCFTSA